MYSPSFLDEFYKNCINKLSLFIPEGIYVVDLRLLHQFDLLHFQPGKFPHHETLLERNFHLIESCQKMTWVNEKYIIWISFDQEESSNAHALIAYNHGEKEPKLEAAFFAAGIYNSRKLIMRLLEKFLADIEETDQLLSNYQNFGF